MEIHYSYDKESDLDTTSHSGHASTSINGKPFQIIISSPRGLQITNFSPGRTSTFIFIIITVITTTTITIIIIITIMLIDLELTGRKFDTLRFLSLN